MAVTQGSSGRRLSAQDWAEAALRAVGSDGLAGIAVEPLAARLGTTKGSFYWHFANRDALVSAALERWEEAHTEAIIAAVGGEPDPASRLRKLFAAVSASAAASAVEANLLAAADHPLVAPVMRRVVARRTAFLSDIFLALGFSPEEAGRRALAAYAAYLGTTQLSLRLASVLPSDRAGYEAYVDTQVRMLLSS